MTFLSKVLIEGGFGRYGFYKYKKGLFRLKTGYHSKMFTYVRTGDDRRWV